MYSLHLNCSSSDVEALSTELWERGTAGIREIEHGNETILIAGFETNAARLEMLGQFASYLPKWVQEDGTDWVEATCAAWPAREVGERIFLAAPWITQPTPQGRVRVTHNPGLACGTGEHPCTQLALEALERYVVSGSTVIDIGTGSGMLAIAAVKLGATRVVGVDLDDAALHAARENFELNGIAAVLAVGSADCIRDHCADVTVANISGTVLLSIVDELLRVTKPGGMIVMTGFPEPELAAFARMFPRARVTAMNEWRCIAAKYRRRVSHEQSGTGRRIEDHSMSSGSS